MSPAVRNSIGVAFTLALGAVLSLIAVPPVYYAWVQVVEIYDQRFPPVTAKLAEHEFVAADVMRFRMYVTREQDCEFVRLLAFTGKSLSEMHPTPVRRLDGSEPISYPTGMTVVSVPWVISPVRGPRFTLHGYYDCHGRVVRTKLIDEVVK